MTDKSTTTELVNLSIALDQFREVMGEKLAKAALQGARGWDNPDYLHHLQQQLINHFNDWIDEGDNSHLIDLANYAMFLWWLDKKEKESGD